MHGHEVYCFYTTSFDDICTHRNMKRLVATCEKPTPPLPAMPDINTQKRPPHLPLTESSGTSIESQPHLGTCWSVGEHACRNRFSRSQPAYVAGLAQCFLPASFCLEVLQTRRKYECKCYFSSTKDRVEVLKHARKITRVLTPSSLEKLKDPQYTVPSVASGFAHLPKSI